MSKCENNNHPTNEILQNWILSDREHMIIWRNGCHYNFEKYRPTKQTNSVAWVRRRELYRPSDRRLSAKLMPTLADRGCRVVSATNPPQSLISGFLDRSRHFLEIAPQLPSRGWVDPVLDPLLLWKKSGNAGNRTRTSGSVAWNSDH
jgi:hypothetical protein